MLTNDLWILYKNVVDRKFKVARKEYTLLKYKYIKIVLFYANAGAFNPNLDDPLPGQLKKQLVLKIISGQQLPKPKDSMLGDRGEVIYTHGVILEQNSVIWYDFKV